MEQLEEHETLMNLQVKMKEKISVIKQKTATIAKIREEKSRFWICSGFILTGTMSGAYVSGMTCDNVQGYSHPIEEGVWVFAMHDESGDTKLVGAKVQSLDPGRSFIMSSCYISYYM